jgi:hypothetical protein
VPADDGVPGDGGSGQDGGRDPSQGQRPGAMPPFIAMIVPPARQWHWLQPILARDGRASVGGSCRGLAGLGGARGYRIIMGRWWLDGSRAGRYLVRREGVADRFGQPPGDGLGGTDLGEKVACRRSQARVLGQAAFNQRPDLTRNLVQPGGVMDNAVDQRGGGPFAEGRPAGHREREDRTQAEYISGRPNVMALGLLG